MTGLLRRNPGFARLLAAQIPADFADWLAFIAVASLLAYHWQAPPFAFAALGIAMGLPYVVIGPLAGVMVDRWPLGAVLFWSNLGRGAAVLSYALAPDWPVLVALVAVAASVDATFTPAKQAALHALVGPDDRIAANGLSQSVNQISKIAGPALGGALLAVTAPVWVFVATAAASALAAVLVLGLPMRPRAAEGRAAEGILAGIGAGLDLIRQSLPLRGAILLMTGGYVAIFMYDTLIAPLLGEFGQGAGLLGLCVAANGLGGVAGALGGAVILRRGNPFLWVAGALALGAVGTGGMGALALAGVVPPAWALIATFAAVGVVGAGSIIPLRTVIQNATPEGAMGRVAALTEAAATSALLVAPMIGAGLATLGGTGLPFVAGAAIALVFAVIAVALARRLA